MVEERIVEEAIAEGTIVAKFGGTSLANPERIKDVAEIIKSDDRIRYVVFSAPGVDKGKRDVKITDVLYNLHSKCMAARGFGTLDGKKHSFKTIDFGISDLSYILKETFSGISSGLGLDGRIEHDIISEIDSMIRNPEMYSEDYFASRGENYNTRLIADYIGMEFVDATEIIYAGDDPSEVLGHNGVTRDLMQKRFLHYSQDSKIVAIPGFYCSSSLEKRIVRVFNRGGSDLTGSLVASGVGASEYQNWSDQDGVLSVNPKLIDESLRKDIPVVKRMSYDLASEAVYLDFSILCDDVFVPLVSKGIPVNVRNTFNPSAPGTRIESHVEPDNNVSAIAMKSGYSGLVIEKSRIHKQVGFGMHLSEILARHEISYDHIPSGINNMTVIIETSMLDPVRDGLISDVNETIHPDNVYIKDGLTMIAVLGERINGNSEADYEITLALRDAGIKPKIRSLDLSGKSHIIGISDSDSARAYDVLYRKLIMR